MRDGPTRAFAILSMTLVGTFLVAGCSLLGKDRAVFGSTKNDYLDAKEAPASLIVPEDLDATAVRDSWPIPVIELRPLQKVFPDKAPMPTALWGREDDSSIRIKKLGERRWIVVGETPDQVWPVVKQFLADNGVGIAGQRAEEGLIFSEALKVEDEEYADVVRAVLRSTKRGTGSFDGIDQILFRVEQGIRRGSAEVHVRHVNKKTSLDKIDWPEKSSTVSIEAELVNELGAYFAAGLVQPSVSIVGRQISTGSKAAVVRDDKGYPVLHLNVDFDRAWATVGQALERSEMNVTALHRDEGYFEVDIDPEILTGESEGLFRRMIPGQSDRYSDHSVIVRIDAVENGHDVNVRSLKGGPVSVELGEQILVMLREFAA